MVFIFLDMKRFFLLFAAFAVLFTTYSCGICAKLPREDVHIIVRDSVAVSYRDSVVLVPKEVLMEVAPVDSSHLETTYAISDAWIDSLALLHHKLVQKPVKSEYKEKEVIKIQRDTCYIKEPYPVEIKKEVKVHYWYEKYLWIISIIAVAYVGIKIFIKIKLDNPTLFKKN